MNKTFALTLVVAALSAPAVVIAAHPGTFHNGASFSGQPGDAQSASRTVDVTQAKSVNAKYGETIKFVRGAEQFVWTFNGKEGQRVPLAKISSQAFAGTVVYVGQNPYTRD